VEQAGKGARPRGPTLLGRATVSTAIRLGRGGKMIVEDVFFRILCNVVE
jgi:hypothetical protein